MVFRTVGPDYSVPDHARAITGKQGQPALQSNEKLVTRTGAPQAVADIDVPDIDLADGDFVTDTLDIGGTSGIALFITSQDNETFEAVLELRDEDGTLLGTLDDTVFADLSGTTINIVVPVFSDRVQLTLRDTSGAQTNTVSGSGNANIGTPSQLNAQIQGGQIQIAGASDQLINEQTLDTAAAPDSVSLVTYLARSLDSQGLDELVSRLTDTGGTQINPATNDDQPNWFDDNILSYDLVGSGDYTTGEIDIRGTTHLILKIDSADGRTFSVSVEWTDGSGNALYTQNVPEGTDVTNTNLKFNTSSDHARITITDTSSLGSNAINGTVNAN